MVNNFRNQEVFILAYTRVVKWPGDNNGKLSKIVSLDVLWPSTQLFGLDASPLGILFYQSSFSVGAVNFYVAYPLVAWIGIILLGFGSASIFTLKPVDSNRRLIQIGSLFIAAFVVLRALGIYGDANHWQLQDNTVSTLRDFMNVSKYPPSLLFTLITLGPMAIFCALSGYIRGWLRETLLMFGRVPFAFYILHIYLLHTLSTLLGVIQGFEATQFMTFFPFFPEGYGFSLGMVYIIWLFVLAILYPACKWFAEVKSRRKDWWLSYL